MNSIQCVPTDFSLYFYTKNIKYLLKHQEKKYRTKFLGKKIQFNGYEYNILVSYRWE